MNVLVHVEVTSGAVSADTTGLIAHLVDSGFDVSALVIDDGLDAAKLATLAPSRVFVARDKRFAATPVAATVCLIAELCRSHQIDTVLFTTSATSVELAGRLSALLEAAIVWNVARIDNRAGAPCLFRAALSDSLLAEVACEAPLQIGLVRPGAFDAPADTLQQARAVIDTDCAALPFDGSREVDRRATTASPAIANADIIVAGGRGLGSAENLQLVRDLADVLGGTVGVSLPLVDMGWAPRALQVGQTGTIVQPRLYIACGISGQIQHKIGMERAKIIIAINTDRTAPIMAFCDLAVVGDARQILPDLTKRVRMSKGQDGD